MLEASHETTTDGAVRTVIYWDDPWTEHPGIGAADRETINRWLDQIRYFDTSGHGRGLASVHGQAHALVTRGSRVVHQVQREETRLASTVRPTRRRTSADSLTSRAILIAYYKLRALLMGLGIATWCDACHWRGKWNKHNHR